MKKTKKSNSGIPPKLLEALLEHSDGHALFGAVPPKLQKWQDLINVLKLKGF
ncbi:MAG: hypothetical protein HRU28_10195 [Rhizobiales bacterium]|nr:hypothetical protein [Hyphomicrobiales bacterium]